MKQAEKMFIGRDGNIRSKMVIFEINFNSLPVSSSLKVTELSFNICLIPTFLNVQLYGLQIYYNIVNIKNKDAKIKLYNFYLENILYNY